MMMMTKGKTKFSFSYGNNGNRIVFLPILLFDSIQLDDGYRETL